MDGEKVREIIEAFEKLPKEEQDKVLAYFFGAEGPVGLKPVANEVSEEFKQSAAKVFDQNSELFKQLAD